ncbi:MAG TPA: ABC transporter substrate-binding protein [Casimicrobiaceae bacterium]|nr:ABC transporter substrate-binding protein [Casimicrobiaceae bacterium]
MSRSREHPYISRLKKEYNRGRVDRREFLRTATLLGVSATAAYGLLGLADPGRSFAQTALPRGGRVRVGMRVHEIKDPHTISWVEASNILRQNCDYLTRTGRDNVTRPWLLERWEATPDLKTWTLRLRNDVKWSNGKPLVADHVIWNIRRAVDPATGSSVLGLLKGFMLDDYQTDELDKDGKKRTSTRLWDSRAIEKVDDHTIRLNGKAAQLAIPEHLFHYPFYMLYPEENGAFKVGMTGTGPFTLESYEVGRRAVMRARKDYWGRPANLDTVEFIDLGSDPSPYIAALASRQVDGLFEVDFGQLDAIKALPHVEIYSVTTAQTAVARGKFDEKPFNDKRVRMALKLAADPQKVLDIVMRGSGAVAEHHHVAAVHPEYAKLPPMRRDVARARQLLAEAGYKDGIDLDLACQNQPAWEQAAVTVLVESWKEAGIRTKINLMPSTEYWKTWTKVPFGFTRWTHRPLGVMTYSLAYRSGVPWNEASYSNPEFDRLLTEAEGVLDVEKRRAIMAKLEAIMQEDGPIVQPIWRAIQTAFDKRVKGFAAHPTLYLFAEELAVSG